MDQQEMRIMTRHLLDIYRCLDTIREAQFSKFGLTRGQHAFLTRIAENPGINQEKLSFLLKVDRSSTTKALKKLIDKGLVVKAHSEHNKKDWVLSATPKGLELNRRMDDLVNSTNAELYKGINARDAQKLAKLLSLMDANLIPLYQEARNPG